MTDFGSRFASQMTVSSYTDGAWSPMEIVATHDLSLHPGAHALHYGSTCFEGLKAYRQAGDQIRIFRLDRHISRMRDSATQLCLPVPEPALLRDMICDLVDAVRNEVPEYPSALYLRPLLYGCEADIGKAARPSDQAQLIVMASPVGNYFRAGERPLRLWIEDRHMRSTPGFGAVKTGGNYAAALRPFLTAKEKHNVDQILFCPDGDVQESGAANFLLINEQCVLTKRLDGTILPGITRASILDLARHAGFNVEERDISLEEMLEFIKTGEAALSGTAAVLAGVGTLLHGQNEYCINDGQVGPNTKRLRAMLTGIQSGEQPDIFDWLRTV